MIVKAMDNISRAMDNIIMTLFEFVCFMSALLFGNTPI